MVQGILKGRGGGHARKLRREVTRASYTKDCHTAKHKCKVDSDGECAPAAPPSLHKIVMKHHNTTKVKLLKQNMKGIIDKEAAGPRIYVGGGVGVGGAGTGGKARGSKSACLPAVPYKGQLIKPATTPPAAVTRNELGSICLPQTSSTRRGHAVNPQQYTAMTSCTCCNRSAPHPCQLQYKHQECKYKKSDPCHRQSC